MENLNEQIYSHLTQNFEKQHIRDIANHFKKFGFVKIPNIVSQIVKSKIHDEAHHLLEKHAERRDITLATTNHTPRKLSIVHSEMVSQYGHFIRQCAETPSLISFLSLIAGEELLLNVKADEKFVITKQEHQGDTHGWHWGDYAFALIWLIEVPPLECGGMLQCVPHTSWDKDNARINELLTKNPINTYGFEKGDVYFLRTDTTLHRTVPLSKDATRIMLNMTWANHADIERNQNSIDDRWWSNAKASEAKAIAA